MQIEQSIYQRLSSFTALTDLVGTKIFPNVPTDNSQIPAVTYRIVSAEPQLTTAGSADLTKYLLQIDVWAFNLDTTMSAMGAVKNALHMYQGGNIHRAFLNSQNTEQAEDGYNGVLQFTVWGTTANVTATTTANAVIQTGTDFINLNACSHQLRLDCNGLLLDGQPLFSLPTNLAYTDANNAFSGNNTFSNTNTFSNANTFSGNNTLSGNNSFSGTNTFSATNNFNAQQNIKSAVVGTSTDTSLYANGMLQAFSNNVGSPTVVVKSMSAQTANLTEWRDSAGSVRAGLSPQQAISGQDNFYFYLRPGTRNYYIGTYDAAGSMYFGLSSTSNSLRFTPQDNNVRVFNSIGDLYLSAGGAGNGMGTVNKIILTPSEGGGTSTVQIGRRRSDSSSGVGGSLEIWTNTSQTLMPFSVLAPGGSSALYQVKPDGQPEILTAGQGLILKSPNGTRYRITVSDSGTVSAATY